MYEPNSPDNARPFSCLQLPGIASLCIRTGSYPHVLGHFISASASSQFGSVSFSSIRQRTLNFKLQHTDLQFQHWLSTDSLPGLTLYTAFTWRYYLFAVNIAKKRGISKRHKKQKNVFSERGNSLSFCQLFASCLATSCLAAKRKAFTQKWCPWQKTLMQHYKMSLHSHRKQKLYLSDVSM